MALLTGISYWEYNLRGNMYINSLIYTFQEVRHKTKSIFIVDEKSMRDRILTIQYKLIYFQIKVKIIKFEYDCYLYSI